MVCSRLVLPRPRARAGAGSAPRVRPDWTSEAPPPLQLPLPSRAPGCVALLRPWSLIPFPSTMGLSLPDRGEAKTRVGNWTGFGESGPLGSKSLRPGGNPGCYWEPHGVGDWGAKETEKGKGGS